MPDEITAKVGPPTPLPSKFSTFWLVQYPPTCEVLHRTETFVSNVEQARARAAQIPGSRLITIPGYDELSAIVNPADVDRAADALADAVDQFSIADYDHKLTGEEEEKYEALGVAIAAYRKAKGGK